MFCTEGHKPVASQDYDSSARMALPHPQMSYNIYKQSVMKSYRKKCLLGDITYVSTYARIYVRIFSGRFRGGKGGAIAPPFGSQ